MRCFTLHSELWTPLPQERVFPFFADARNLERITPGWLHFRIETPGPIVMGEGTTIDYRLRLHGVGFRWRTLISAWEPPRRFVDEQLRGPYVKWVHEHTFEEQRGGTLNRDCVEYAVPGGALIHALFVRRLLERIFAHRRNVLEALFSQPY